MRSFLVFLLLFNIGLARSSAFVITEFMAINDALHADEQGEFDDWVEVYNPEDAPQDLGGLYLSNDREDPTLWRLPGDTVIAPLGRLLIWLDNDPEQGPLHAPLRLSGAGGVVILTDRDGETLLDEIEYPAQHPDIAFGRAAPEAEATIFLLRPTPGEPNDPTGVFAIGGVNYSRPAGVFNEAFEVTLSTETEGGVIRYTTNGREPSIFNGTTYTEPFTISESMCLRAHVTVGGQVVSPLATQIYLLVDDDVSNFDSNLPVVLIDSRGYDFSQDTSPGFPQSSVCSVFFDAEENERASVKAEPCHVGRAGMNVRGASSRGWPKKQFKFETWGELDEDRDVALLGLPADSDWILAAPYFDKSLMRNEITFRWWEKLGYYSPRTRFIELFVDMDGDERFTMDDYQGVYVLTEKIKSSADRLEINEDGYILEATNVNQHWTSATGIRLKYVDPREGEEVPDRKQAVREHYSMVEQAVLNDDFQDPTEGYRKHLDLPSHVDYDIMRELSRNIDGASTFLSLNDAGKVQMGPLWDYNQSYGLTRLFDPVPGWRTDGWNGSYMTNGGHWMKWWDQLDEDPEYQQQWEDRWVQLRQGVFTNEALLGDIGAIASLLDEGAQRNFERWDALGKAVWSTGGSTRADPGEGERDTYAKEVGFIREWLTARLEWIDSQVPSPPSFNQNGGAVPAGFDLEMNPGTEFKGFTGSVYYTVDGSDPRESGGTINTQASVYGAVIPLSEDTIVTARARSLFGGWSTLRRATFLVGTESSSSSNLTVSEIHYNPEGADDLEFVELVNRGQVPIDLSNVQIQGAVDFTFPTRSLGPNEVILVVEDQEAFLAHYQSDEFLVAGQWEGALGNGGEEVVITTPSGEPILAFAYDDSEGWPTMADGTGASLERISITSDNLGEASAWRASAQTGGSPGLVGESRPALSYADWQASFGEDLMGDPAADPDGDHYANLIEFALGSSPIDRSAFPSIKVQRNENTLEIVHPKTSERKVVITLESSVDLIEWSEVEMVTQEESAAGVVLRSGEMQDLEGLYLRLRISL
ncbi:CotH kinase family protein [Verrucomicrobiales bacterium]|nr:CotH kinase family protein [Verrucomicrobiales bacterium]